MTNYNPTQAGQGVLYPCHSIILQFFVNDGFLDMYCFNRSSDLFLGLPFNIASSSLLLMIVAQMTNLIPRMFNLSLGDCHIYEAHLEAVKEQMDRIPFTFPTLIIQPFENVEDLSIENFQLSSYTSYPSIKAPMIS